ncbi:MAG: hypothetical protein HZB67_02570 [Candidatus Aenigmarchaeota archaeon]|nr:hypothetical protein [Candidatus Aenigmarchaeota archaeon]
MNPALSLLEFVAFGALLNSQLVLLNAGILFSLALGALIYQKQVSEATLRAVLSLGEKPEETLGRNWPAFVVLLIMVFAFFARFATSWSPYFFEFDPIYYTHVTGYLVKQGYEPLYDDDAYYPVKKFHRVPPLMHYMTGSWYVLYKDFLGQSYSKEMLLLTAQVYPPLLAALMCFLAYIFLRDEYDKWIAILGAAFFALMPQLIQKMAAGVAEQQPFGIFTALAIFVLYALAYGKKSFRIALLAGLAVFAAVLGSAQFVWPLLVVSAYIMLQTLLDFFRNSLDSKAIVINAIVAAGALLGNAVLALYQANPPAVYFWPGSILFIVVATVPGLILYLSTFKLKISKGIAFGGLLGIMLVLAVVTPLGERFYGYINYGSVYAKPQSPLMMTVQEENPTYEGMFASSFGELFNPKPLLAILAVIVAVSAFAVSFTKNKVVSVAVIVFALVLTALNRYVAEAISLVFSWFNLSGIMSLDIMLYFLAATVSVVVYFHYSEKREYLLVLFILIIFPIAYVGLNKLKYMVHLSFALSLAAAFILGETMKLLIRLNNSFKITSERSAKLVSLSFILLIGFIMVGAQATKVLPMMEGLKGTRIWWDYGHWTTFFGESHTVLDPGNFYWEYDLETAHAFVDGTLGDLYFTMKNHNATHVLVDSELVPKWGALTYLAGVCYKNISARISEPTCPVKPGIEDWRKGAGASDYEREHYFEYMYVSQQECPKRISPVRLSTMVSSFWRQDMPLYCVTQPQNQAGELLLISQECVEDMSKPYCKWPYKITSGKEKEIDYNMSYLLPIGTGAFLNLNPQLGFIGKKSKLLDSAFARLYFLEDLPGFELVYRSPQNGQVKIFKYVGNAAKQSS